jgi:hypothetical protein
VYEPLLPERRSEGERFGTLRVAICQVSGAGSGKQCDAQIRSLSSVVCLFTCSFVNGLEGSCAVVYWLDTWLHAVRVQPAV